MSKKTAQTPETTSVYFKYAPIILVLFSVFLYANTLSHGFVLDDRAVITQNKFVQQGLAGIPDILTTFYWKGYWNQNGGLYRPLSLLLFAIEWQLSEGSPFLFHFIQLLLYALTTWLVYRFVARISGVGNVWLPVIVTALFVAHPVHTEVVANIKSADEILCLLFFLISALLLLNTTGNTLQRKALVAFTFLLCLLAKEGGLLFLPLLLMLSVWFNNHTIKSVLTAWWPLLLVAGIWLGWHQYVVHDGGNLPLPYTYQDNALVACGGKLSQVATGIGMLGAYMLKCIWPYTLSYDYSFNQIPCRTFADAQVWLIILLSIGLIAGAIRYRKAYPVVSFGVLFFFVSIFLTSNIVILIGATAADRFLYAPVLGVLIALVWLIQNEAKRWQPAPIYTNPLLLFFVMLGLYSFKTVNRNAAWKSDETLFATDITTGSNSARVYYNYASLLLNQPVADEATRNIQLGVVVSNLTKAAAIDSMYPNTYINLGVAYYKLKNYKAAITSLQRAVQLNPSGDAMHNLADAFFRNNELDSSIYYHTQCIKTGYILTDTWNMLGTAYFSKKEYALARNAFESGIKKDTTNASLYLNYGNVLGALNQPDAAIAAFEKAYALNPDNKQPLYFIATAYTVKGDMQKAAEYMSRYNGR
ncbi:MAG: hypothetical protein RLZZ367_2502 [Bacteroidota bacterium]